MRFYDKAKEMMEREIMDRVRSMVEPILLDERMELVDIEYRRESKGWVLRLTLDKEGGITLDDCTRISQEVGRSLDVEDFIKNRQRLHEIFGFFDQSKDRRSPGESAAV
jgi:ribosome maturation factor RimP